MTPMQLRMHILDDQTFKSVWAANPTNVRCQLTLSSPRQLYSTGWLSIILLGNNSSRQVEKCYCNG